MRIAVVGAGGTGGYFGGLLARAGEDVTFIARGACPLGARTTTCQELRPVSARFFEVETEMFLSRLSGANGPTTTAATLTLPPPPNPPR